MPRPSPVPVRRLAVAGVAALVWLAASPAAPRAAPSGSFGASSQGIALALTLAAVSPSNPAGVTLGISTAQASSNPTARGRGGGTCNALAIGGGLADLPCDEVNSVAADAPPDADPGERCQAALPGQLGTVVSLVTACGDAFARVVGRDPSAEGSGRVARLETRLDLSALNPQLEGTKDQLIDQLGSLLLQPLPLPDAVKTALTAALKGEQKALAVQLGTTTSRAFSQGTAAVGSATASGGLIGIIGVPTCTTAAPVTCAPVPDPLTDGLVIVELADGSAEARWDSSTSKASATAAPRLVKVHVRDLSKPAERAYTTVELNPGQTQTLFAGTPLETTIAIAQPFTSVSNQDDRGTATADAGGLTIHALKGLGANNPPASNNGGLRLLAASAQASANGQQVSAVLAATGGPAPAHAAAALLLLAGAAHLARLRRRMAAP